MECRAGKLPGLVTDPMVLIRPATPRHPSRGVDSPAFNRHCAVNLSSYVTRRTGQCLDKVMAWPSHVKVMTLAVSEADTAWSRQCSALLWQWGSTVGLHTAACSTRHHIFSRPVPVQSMPYLNLLHSINFKPHRLNASQKCYWHTLPAHSFC